MIEMTDSEIRALLLEIARKCIAAGEGYSQVAVVMHKAAKRLPRELTLHDEQRVLRCWHGLFTRPDGVLVPGFSVDNPNEPFFHERVAITEEETYDE
ncbi:MAG TPA: hypothetical protein ENH11_00465 [Candidatus Acetothermia bacterium]|nr:hypothetical protein [Candidatus Acetothermia bacterium]